MPSETDLWMILLASGLGTFLLRYSFFAGTGNRAPSPGFHRLLRYVPTAALAAIALPGFLAPEGALALSLANPRLVAGLIAALVAFRTRGLMATIVVGMVALWLQTLPIWPD